MQYPIKMKALVYEFGDAYWNWFGCVPKLQLGSSKLRRSESTAAAPASTDQEHLRVMIWSDPTVPDRSAAIAGHGEDPTPRLIEGAQHLADAGAAFYVVTWNGAHAFLPRVREAVNLDYVSIVEVTAEHASSLPHVRKAGLLATDATLESRLYQDALRAFEIESVLPSERDQHTVMEIVYAVKSGRLRDTQRAEPVKIADCMVEQGADAIIAACTEIPLAITEDESPRPLIDPALLLANRVAHEATIRSDS